MNKRPLLVLLFALFSTALFAAEVSWQFEIKEDASGIPRGKVFLKIAGKRHLVDDSVTGEFHPVEKADFKAGKIPGEALTACRGTWSHVSRQFYVISKDGKFQVYKRDEDGEGGFIGKYKLLKTLP